MKKVFLYSFIFLLLFSFPLEGQRISGIDVLGYGRKLFDEGFYKIALMEFSQFLSDSPRSDEAYIAQYYIGECYFLLEDYEKADEAFLILTARYPHSPNVMLGWDGRGKCYEKMNDFKKAAEVFETAGNFFFYKGDAASPFFLYAGRNYLKNNNLSKAQDNFLRIIDNYPGGNEAYEAIYELALIRLGEGEISTALKEFEKVKYISEMPDIAGRARFYSGRIYRGIGDYKKSEYEFLQVIEKFGNDKNLLVNAQLNLGITYLKGRAPQKARDILKKVIQTENLPDSLIIRSMITIGESYFYELNYTESVFQFEEIIKKFPNSTMIDEVFYRLGLCFEDEGNYEQALYHFRRSVEYEPRDKGFSDFQRRALDKLIQLYRQTGRYDEVGYYLERSSQRKENNELLLLKTAQIFEKGSQYQKAGRIYTVLRDRFPKSQHIDYYAFRNGVCFEKAGLIEKSLAIYKGILNDYPGCDFTEEILFKNTILERILKNYGGEISINAGRDVQKDKGPAALSYDLNAYNFYLDGETGKYYAYLDSAYAAYGTIIEEGGFSKDILDFAKVRIAEIFILRESDLLERKKKGIEYYTILMEDNSFSMREFALYRLGEIFANPGYPEAVEIPKSGGLNDLQQGREYYLQLMERYPNSIYLERAHYKLGYSFYIEGEDEEARVQFDTYLREYPYGLYVTAVTAYLGNIELQSQDENEFRERFILFSEKYFYSDYADTALASLGSYYVYDKRLPDALEHYLSLYKRLRNSVILGIKDGDVLIDISNNIAVMYDSVGTPEKAVTFLYSVLDDSLGIGNKSSLYQTLGRIYESAHYYNNAIEIYTKIENEYNDSLLLADILERKSTLLFSMEDYSGAGAVFEKRAELSETNIERARLLSKVILCLYRDNKINGAGSKVKQFEEEFKNNLDKEYYKYFFMLEQGKAYYRAKNFTGARKIFKDIVKKAEKKAIAPESALYLGLILQAQKNDVDALKQFNTTASDYPDNIIWDKIYNTLGNYYYSIGKVAEAARYFRMSIEYSSSDYVNKRVLNNLILSYKHSEWYDSELRELRKYIKRFPNAADVFQKKINIGTALLNLGDYKSAIEYSKPLLREASLEDEVFIQMTIAEGYEGLGNYNKAISEWLKVLYYGRSKLPHLSTTVRFKIAGICEKAGLLVKALEFYEEIVKKEGASSDFGRFAQEGIEKVNERLDSIKEKRR